MAIIYRSEKGCALSADEVDGNFRDLDQRIKELEKNDMGRRLEQIVQQGDLLIMQDQVGGELGRAKIPIISLNPRGEWQSNADYIPNDVVTYKSAAYICHKHHRSEEFEPSKWQLLLKLKHED